MGAIFDLLSDVLAMIPTIHFPDKINIDGNELKLNVPRMIDFAKACEAVCRMSGYPEFESLCIFERMRKENILSSLDADVVFNAITGYFAKQRARDGKPIKDHKGNITGYDQGDTEITGSYLNVMARLKEFAPDKNKWPGNAKEFSNALNRIHQNIQVAGFEIIKDKQRKKDGYYVTIKQNIENEEEHAAEIAVPLNTADTGGAGGRPRRHVVRHTASNGRIGAEPLTATTEMPGVTPELADVAEQAFETDDDDAAVQNMPPVPDEPPPWLDLEEEAAAATERIV